MFLYFFLVFENVLKMFIARKLDIRVGMWIVHAHTYKLRTTVNSSADYADEHSSRSRRFNWNIWCVHCALCSKLFKKKNHILSSVVEKWYTDFGWSYQNHTGPFFRFSSHNRCCCYCKYPVLLFVENFFFLHICAKLFPYG